MANHIGQQLGNYLITRSIGRGGFAEVFLGEHIYLKTQVAIKMLKTAVANNALNAQNQNQWDQNAGCAFTGGTYHVITTAADHYTPCMAKNTNFKNIAYQVQMATLSGTGGGLIFRSDQAVRMYYRFSLDNQGLYKLFICQQCNNGNGGGTSLVQANIPFAVQSNTLTVIANNNALYLYINGVFIKQVSDATASSGEIGLYGFSTSEVSFSNLKVWRLP